MSAELKNVALRIRAGHWLSQYLFESIAESQLDATQWLGTYNY